MILWLWLGEPGSHEIGFFLISYSYMRTGDALGNMFKFDDPYDAALYLHPVI